MKIIFYDTMTPALYTHKTLLESGLGGTEATVARIAKGLGNTFEVYVAQHCRRIEDEVSVDNVQYIAFETAKLLTPDIVILLRDITWVEKIAEQFPAAKRFLWLHNMPSKSLYKARRLLIKQRFEIISVSNFHKKVISRRLKGKWFQNFFGLKKDLIPEIHVLYNPISETLQVNNSKLNSQQMIFASAPYKGLVESLAMFEKVLEAFPEYRLVIATHAGWDESIKLPDQASFLGSLSHSELIEKVRESFCVFYPQWVRSETFGLVYAEANAVGTPVLAHDIGAAGEVLSDGEQLVDGRSVKEVVGKIRKWREERLVVRGKPEFRFDRVIESWVRLMGGV